MRTDGKGSRPHVFSLVPNTAMRSGTVLDVAASSPDELKEWVVKIREVTMTSEAKVCISLGWQETQAKTHTILMLNGPVMTGVCSIILKSARKWYLSVIPFY